MWVHVSTQSTLYIFYVRTGDNVTGFGLSLLLLHEFINVIKFRIVAYLVMYSYNLVMGGDTLPQNIYLMK